MQSADGQAGSATRVMLLTGKGGVGKTTLSAATAVTSAEQGTRTLLVSADQAHSLGDVLVQELGSDPTPIADNLDGVQLDGRHELQRTWASITGYLRRLLGIVELDRLHADELLMIPGLDQLVALVRLRELVKDGRWGAIVVDCAPSADSLRLLALPDVLAWYVERIFGRNGTALRWARRRIERTLAVPLPDEGVVSSITQMTDELAGLRAVLDHARTTARIVVTPERMVIAEGQRTLAYLALYGYAVDAVLVNRTPVPDHHNAEGLLPAPASPLERIDAAFACFPRLTVRQRSDEPIGLDRLREVGRELYGDEDPLASMTDRQPLEIIARDDQTVVRLLVTGLRRDQIGVERVRDELVVTLDAYRRTVHLPDALRHQDVVRAGLAGDHLEVVFAEQVSAC